MVCEIIKTIIITGCLLIQNKVLNMTEDIKNIFIQNLIYQENISFGSWKKVILLNFEVFML